MILFFFFFGLSLAAVAPSDGQEMKLLRGGCPMFWYSFNGRCYKYVATLMTWADAEWYCLSENANLVSIHSLEEQNFVMSLIKNFDHAQGATWTGLSDNHKEGKWMWSDGTRARYASWSAGQPDNWNGNEDCGVFNYGPQKAWNDCSCSIPCPSVCASRIV
uniref:Lactose-binding lectin l-2-like n=1 Tax=Fundulus heteroclitus TaxID=8078 RepID=A0A3Q2UBP8_FUNHE